MIECRAVSQQFPQGTLAVDRFSLIIPSRQFTVFAGSSGGKKTTVLRMINRMVAPTSGQVLINVDDVDDVDDVAAAFLLGNPGIIFRAGVLSAPIVSAPIASTPIVSAPIVTAQDGISSAMTGPKSRSVSNKTDQAGDA